MSHRNHQLDMSHTLTSNLLLRNLNTTTVTNDTLVPNTFIFTAMTFVILHRTEDSLAEQTITFGFVCTIVNRLRF